MSAFFHGMIAMGFLIASLLFLRFWRRTRDGLFVVFALSFLLLALNQGLVSVSGSTSAGELWAFLPSLGAFGLLLAAILIKNFSHRDS